MKLKGTWKNNEEYAVGDVVQYIDGKAYHLQKECPVGTTPFDTLYWNQTNQMISDVVGMILDMVTGIEDSIPKNIDDEGIVLKTEDAEYYVYVDDSGETPELAVEAVDDTPVEDGGGK